MSDLLDGLLKVSVLLLVTLIAVELLKRRSAALRHWVLTTAIVFGLATPLFSRLVPPWLDGPLWRRSDTRETPARHATIQVAQMPHTDIQTEFSVLRESSPSAERRDPWAIARGIWLFGGLLSAFVVVVGLARLWWLARHARLIDDSRWVRLVEHTRHTYGISSPVLLLESQHSALLVTWGWRRPKVLVPTAARQWTDERIRVVLAHELAHVSRGDWAVQLAAAVLRSIYWFTPLLWIACRRLRIESECACDDAVLASGIAGPEYATHLLALARSVNARRQSWLPAPAMARSSSLEGRIRAMLSTTRNRHPVSWPARVVTVCALLALTVPLAGLRAQSPFYSLVGTVVDPTTRVLPDARVVLTNTTSHTKYEVRTDAMGRFEFVGLQPAMYTLAGILPGFATSNEDLQIVGNTDREIRLRVGSLQETITVTARGVPTILPDAATLAKWEDSKRRFAADAQKEQARCSAGGATTSIGGRILPPAKLQDKRPIYPDELRVAKVGGTVTMDAVIGADGTVRDLQNLHGPHPDLEAAAAEAVRQWQFSSTLLNCEPIDVSMSVTVNFSAQP